MLWTRLTVRRSNSKEKPIPDNNNFNELLIHTLKQIHIRLDRLEAKIDEKTDKTDLKIIEME